MGQQLPVVPSWIPGAMASGRATRLVAYGRASGGSSSGSWLGRSAIDWAAGEGGQHQCDHPAAGLRGDLKRSERLACAAIGIANFVLWWLVRKKPLDFYQKPPLIEQKCLYVGQWKGIWINTSFLILITDVCSGFHLQKLLRPLQRFKAVLCTLFGGSPKAAVSIFGSTQRI
jgi:hypothetical protein